MDDTIFEDFHQFVIQQGINLSRNIIQHEKEIFRQIVLREIAGRLWGDEGRNIIDVINDNNIYKVRSLF